MMGSSLALSLGLRALPYLGVLALAGALYVQGYRAASQKAELAEARATIEVLHEQARRTAIALEYDSKAAQKAAAESQTLKQKLEDYETALKARPDAGCMLTDDDIEWLRQFE